MRPSQHRARRSGVAAAATLALLSLTACGSDDTAADGGAGAEESSAPTASSAPRLAVSYEDGIAVLDGETLEVVAEMESEEFTRLNPAGDGRHVMVTVADGFQLLDTGAGSESGEPELTNTVFAADTPGHVVSHAGKTVLYADGTSDTTVLETDALAEGADGATTIEGTEAHHGVSIVLEDGTLVTTVGTEDARTGAVALDADGEEIVRSEDCPGVHGEGTAADEVVVLGCEDGALLYRDGAFEKVAAPTPGYARMGNVFVTETSPLVVGDHNTDPDAEGYLLDAVSVVDTAAGTYDVVDLPEGAQYTFRDLARGPGDLGYVLATDGSIHVLDPETRELTDSYPVIEPWEGPAEWQQPHPSIKVSGDVAYVSEPASNQVHAVDLTTGEVLTSATLSAAPNEMALSS